MEYLQKLNEIGWPTVLTVVFLLILALPAISESLNKFVSHFGIETKWSRKRKKESEELQALQDEVNAYRDNRIHDREQSLEIQKKLTDNQQDLKDSILELKQLFIHKEIEDMRWELLDFANAINIRKYNKEQYDHALEVYSDYEKILEENQMENGRVDISMEFVKKKYAELMENGFEQ